MHIARFVRTATATSLLAVTMTACAPVATDPTGGPTAGTPGAGEAPRYVAPMELPFGGIESATPDSSGATTPVPKVPVAKQWTMKQAQLKYLLAVGPSNKALGDLGRAARAFQSAKSDAKKEQVIMTRIRSACARLYDTTQDLVTALATGKWPTSVRPAAEAARAANVAEAAGWLQCAEAHHAYDVGTGLELADQNSSGDAAHAMRRALGLA